MPFTVSRHRVPTPGAPSVSSSTSRVFSCQIGRLRTSAMTANTRAHRVAHHVLEIDPHGRASSHAAAARVGCRGAAGARWPDSSSKRAGRGAPPPGRFDSYAAPLGPHRWESPANERASGARDAGRSAPVHHRCPIETASPAVSDLLVKVPHPARRHRRGLRVRRRRRLVTPKPRPGAFPRNGNRLRSRSRPPGRAEVAGTSTGWRRLGGRPSRNRYPRTPKRQIAPTGVDLAPVEGP